MIVLSAALDADRTRGIALKSTDTARTLAIDGMCACFAMSRV
jgi:hypothetical protein